VQLLARAQALAQALGREPQLAPALPVLHAGAAPRG